MPQEDLVEDHVRVAEVVRVACPRSRLGSIAFDDRLHLLRGQVGVQAFAEFAGQGVDEGLRGGSGSEQMARYSARAHLSHAGLQPSSGR